MRRILFYLLVSVVLFTQCTESQDNQITTDPQEINIGYEGGERTVMVSCNAVTRIRIDWNGDVKNWASLSLSSLPGDGEFTVSINKNEGYQEPRSANIVIAGEGVRKVIAINQEGSPVLPPTRLILDKSRYSFDVEGGSLDIKVSSNGEWKAESNRGWCKVLKGSGKLDGTFTVEVPASEDYQYRTAEVTVTAGNAEPVVLLIEHVGTKIGDQVWANSNVDEPDTFAKNCEQRGQLYQWNSKKHFPTYSHNNYGEENKEIPGYEGGAADSGSSVWTDENDPCPDGWRVPTHKELKILYNAEKGKEPHFWFDYDMLNGMSVAGAYVGLTKEECQKCKKGNLNGAIFIAQAGSIDYQSSYQKDWYSVHLWSSTPCSDGNTWDMWSVYVDGNQTMWPDYWTGNRQALGVRCIKK